MTKTLFATRLALMAAALCAAFPASAAAQRACLRSPDRALELCTFVRDGQAWYQLNKDGRALLAPSQLGLVFAGDTGESVRRIGKVQRASRDTQWEQPWGEQRLVRDRHNRLQVSFGNAVPARAFDVEFRLFDDGLGLRYAYRQIGKGKAVAISDERTSFNFADNYQA